MNYREFVRKVIRTISAGDQTVWTNISAALHCAAATIVARRHWSDLIVLCFLFCNFDSLMTNLFIVIQHYNVLNGLMLSPSH